MKRTGAKRPSVRRKKRRNLRFGPPAAYLPSALFAALSALSYSHAWWWLGSVLRELGVWLGAALVCVALGHTIARQWDRALLAGLLAAANIAPFTAFFLRDRQTPSHGPTLDIRHVHLAGRAPSAEKLQAIADTRGAQLLSFTFETPAASHAMPRPAAGFRLIHTAGAGDRLMWARGLSPGTGASTLRVGRCSLALSQVSLPSLFAIGSRGLRHAAIDTLPKRPSHQPSVLIGHLGSSPGAFDIAPALATAELRDARIRHALLGTFPALFGDFGLPLDTPLVHGWVAVRSLEPFDAGLETPYRGVHMILELTEPRCARPARRARE